MKKKKKAAFIITLALVFCIMGSVGISYCMAHKQLSKINHNVLTNDDTKKGININKANSTKNSIDSQYINILLLGVDARKSHEVPRSDSMIIATIDKKHKKIKLTSLMRDMLVSMKGHGLMEGLNQDKLNHAFAYGGPLLTLKTVNENFKTDIRDYVKVDFLGLEKIIDAVGGIEINVTQPEIKLINVYVDEVSEIDNTKHIHVVNSGSKILNGRQTVAYSRIRNVGNEDFQRTERQRTVLKQLFNKASKLNILELDKAIGKFLPYVETSMDESKIINLSSYVLVNKISQIDQLRLPIDGHLKETSVNKMFSLKWDTEYNIESLHRFIYEEDYTYPGNINAKKSK